jgi:hypothetical protein
VVANEEGERNGESDDGGAEEVRAAEQVGAVRAQGLHGWALGPRGDVGAVPCVCVVRGRCVGWDRRRPGSLMSSELVGPLQLNFFPLFFVSWTQLSARLQVSRLPNAMAWRRWRTTAASSSSAALLINLVPLQ